MEDRENGEPEKRVDEGWKEEVRRDKERLRSEERPKRERKAPEASFMALIQQLATQALLQMGLAAPQGQQPRLDLQGAKYAIDILQVLEQKTRGNLTPEETKALAAILADLRAGFVEVATGSGSPGASGPG